MAWELKSDRPIYSQLMEYIKISIVSGKYKPGAKMPSVRELASEASVNPNTMQKALTELERSGLLFSVRTSGRFITEDSKMIEEMKCNLAKEEIQAFLKKMEEIGFTKEEAIETIKEIAEEMKQLGENILECRNLVKSYGNKVALEGIDLSMKRGRIVGLLGPNGSGKSTLIKLANGLLTPTSGELLINGNKPGIETKKIVSYLPERTYLADWMKVSDIINFFKDFYEDFNVEKAYDMLSKLNINANDKLKTMSKGTKEKVQLILVMSREAELYFLDEPIAGVDPAARDYILNTIISNYNENATVVISTHLISDIEQILDDVIFISYGKIYLSKSVDEIREEEGKSVDALFREVFRC